MTAILILCTVLFYRHVQCQLQSRFDLGSLKSTNVILYLQFVTILSALFRQTTQPELRSLSYVPDAQLCAHD